jgi:hypothetical protein
MSVFGNSVSDGGSYEHLSPVRIVYYSMSGERMSQTLDNMVVPFLKKKISEKEFKEHICHYAPIDNMPYIVCIVVEGRIVKSYKILPRK